MHLTSARSVKSTPSITACAAKNILFVFVFCKLISLKRMLLQKTLTKFLLAKKEKKIGALSSSAVTAANPPPPFCAKNLRSHHQHEKRSRLEEEEEEEGEEEEEEEETNFAQRTLSYGWLKSPPPPPLFGEVDVGGELFGVLAFPPHSPRISGLFFFL